MSRFLCLLFVFLSLSAQARLGHINIISQDSISIVGGDSQSNSYVSIAPISKRHYVIANYGDLLLLDRVDKKICVVSAYDASGRLMSSSLELDGFPYRAGSKFNPTGVFYGADDSLFVANYKGNNILIGKIDLDGCAFHLSRALASAETLGPENVYYHEGVVYSANYDAGTVTAHEYLTGQQLWSTAVPQAHGVSFAGGKVYATGLTERKIYELESGTGFILRAVGGLGWNPLVNEYLWPTSIYPISDSHLVVSDAQSGFVSVVDRSTLSVVDYLGGNGASPGLFNYPYAAFPYEGELIILSSMRGDIFFLDISDMRSARKLSFDVRSWAVVKKEPFGGGWEGYVDKSSGKLSFAGDEFFLGFGNLHRVSGGVVYRIPDIGSLFNPGSYIYFLQGRQVGGVSLFFSSSSGTLLSVIKKEGRPDLLLSARIDLDSWLVGDSIVSRASGARSVHDVAAEFSRRASLYYEGLASFGWVSKDRLYEFLGVRDYLSRERFDARLNMAFSSPAGRRFKLAYDRCDVECDLQALRKSALEYFSEVQGLAYVAMDEYLLVGMVAGVGRADLQGLSHKYSDCGDGKYYEGYGVEALASETLNDYASALSLESSVVCLSVNSFSAVKGVDVVWNDASTAAASLSVFARNSLDEPWVKLEDLSGFVIDSSTGYARSRMEFGVNYSYGEYRFVVTDGGPQQRLILRGLRLISPLENSDEGAVRNGSEIISCKGSGSYIGYGLEALVTPSLDDYFSALSLENSSVCFDAADDAVDGVRLGWYSAGELGEYVDVYGSDDLSFLTEHHLGSFAVDDAYEVSGYYFSDVKFERPLRYSYYRVKLKSGFGQNRFILRSASLLRGAESNESWGLLGLARNVSRSLNYGRGVSKASSEIEKSLDGLDALIKASESAHCGNFALAFVKSLPGFLDWVVYDLRTFDGRVHTVVEVDLLYAKHVYDPTLGIEYKCSLKSMIDGDCDYSASASYKLVHPALQVFRGAGFFYGAEIKKTYSTSQDLVVPYF